MKVRLFLEEEEEEEGNSARIEGTLGQGERV